jgi:O-antigen/teichoic acid export membrane protein
VLTFNTQAGIGRYYFEEKDDFGNLLFTSVLLPAILMLISFCFAMVYQHELSELLDLPYKTIPFLVPSMYLIVLSNYVLQLFKSTRNSKVIRNYAIHKTYFSFLVALVLIYYSTTDRYMGRLWADLIVMVVFAVYTFYLIGPYIKIGVKKANLVFLLTFSIPLIPAYISNIILVHFDRIIIAKYIGLSEAGIYSFAYNIASLQTIISNALLYAWIPDFYKHIKAGNLLDHDKDVVRINKLIGFVTAGLILFANQIGIILGSKNYHQALDLLPIIVVGQFFLTFSSFYKNHVDYSKKTWISAGVIIIGAIANVLLNLYLIPKYGMKAGAFTTLCSYLLQVIFMYLAVKFILKSHFTSPLKFIDLAIALTIAVGAYYMISVCHFNFVIDTLLKMSVLALVGIILFKDMLADRFKLKF